MAIGKKFLGYDQIDQVDPTDVFIILDRSDKRMSSEGTTKYVLSSQMPNGYISAISVLNNELVFTGQGGAFNGKVPLPEYQEQDLQSILDIGHTATGLGGVLDIDLNGIIPGIKYESISALSNNKFTLRNSNYNRISEFSQTQANISLSNQTLGDYSIIDLSQGQIHMQSSGTNKGTITVNVVANSILGNTSYTFNNIGIKNINALYSVNGVYADIEGNIDISVGDSYTSGANINIVGNVISAVNTTYSSGSLVELNTGSNTTSKLQSSKNLNDWLDGKGYLEDIIEGIGGIIIDKSNPRRPIISYTNPSSLTDPRTQFINLGNIGTSTVKNGFNSHLFTGSESPVQGQEKGYVIVNVTQNGIPLQYLFLGQGGNYGTSGGKLAIDADFIVVIDQETLSGTQYISIGEIGEFGPEDVFNYVSPCVTVQPFATGYVIINTLVEGKPFQYLFTGAAGSYGAGCGNVSLVNDFIPLTHIPDPFVYDDVWHVQAKGQADSGIRATRFNEAIIHGAEVYAPTLRTNLLVNRGSGWLTIQGNQGTNFRVGNLNYGYFDFANLSPIQNYNATANRYNIRTRRAYNDKMPETYNGGDMTRQFIGVEIADTVDINTKSATSSYIGLHINPAVAPAQTRRIYAIKTTAGDVDISGGDLFVAKTKAPSDQTYMVTVDSNGKFSSQAIASGGGGATYTASSGIQISGSNVITPTYGSAANTVAMGNHTHSNYIDKITDQVKDANLTINGILQATSAKVGAWTISEIGGGLCFSQGGQVRFRMNANGIMEAQADFKLGL